MLPAKVLIIENKGHDRIGSKTSEGNDVADRAARAAAGCQEVSHNMIQMSSDPLLPTMTVEDLKTLPRSLRPYEQHTSSHCCVLGVKPWNFVKHLETILIVTDA